MEAIADRLDRDGWVYAEHFLPDAHALALLDDVKRLKERGEFQRGFLAGDGMGGGVRYVHNDVRGDEVCWANGSEVEGTWTPAGDPARRFERGHSTLSLYLRRMDTLVAELGGSSALSSALGQVSCWHAMALG